MIPRFLPEQIEDPSSEVERQGGGSVGGRQRRGRDGAERGLSASRQPLCPQRHHQ